ncbi:FAD/NAD(P)-binding oxidoreductase [Streptomyces lydicus]|nr:FAD/NAD(P)-binding oxidoreductase [Streptomyces lydicus]
MPVSPSDTRGTVHDLAVIGAGPAGLAAAVTAAELRTDRGPPRRRAPPRRPVLPAAGPRPRRRPPRALHHSWGAFTRRAARLAAQRAAGRVHHLAEHHVWAVTRATADPEHWTVHAVTGPDGAHGPAPELTARHVLLATGAYERQLPFPGWTLPGVVGAAGAQAMLKAGLVLPGRRIVVAGSGPLLLAVAGSLAAAGARVPVVAEAGDYGAYARSPAPWPPSPASSSRRRATPPPWPGTAYASGAGARSPPCTAPTGSRPSP